jgi:outer membrane beta-barrel protein
MRTLLLIAAVLWATVAAAETVKPLVAADAPIAQAKTPTDDDEEDPSPGAKTPPAGDKKTPPAGTDEKKDTAPAPATGAVTSTPAPANADQQKLVSGAPLYNPNVAVHIVEQKAYSDSGKREVILFPGQIQLNGKFTQHFGVGLGFVWHLQENFGFQISGFYNYYSQESGFNAELVEKVNEEAQAATSLLNVWGALAGVEVTPFYGKFAWYENSLAHFSLVLNAGAGIGGTRHQLKPNNSAGPATYGDTGLRFLGGLGGGLRLQIGKRFAIRFEVRDVIYTAKVDSVNGCGRDDLTALNIANNGGVPLTNVKVSSNCNVSSFNTPDTKPGLPLALNLIKPPGNPPPPPSSDVLNNLSLFVGASFIF